MGGLQGPSLALSMHEEISAVEDGHPLLAGIVDSTSPHVALQPGPSMSDYLVNISAQTHRKRHVHVFYQQQNSHIEQLLEAEALQRGDYEGDKEDAAEEAHTQRALNLSFASNIALLVIRVAIAVMSRSLSLLVTTLDAVLDVISGFIIWKASRDSAKKDRYQYPVGKGRMAPLGAVVFCTIMGTAGMSIIAEGILQLVGHHAINGPTAPLTVIIGSSILVIVMKALMWMLCRNSKNSSVQAFALDHLNDVIVNSTGLAGALCGIYYKWWLDPTVAMIMSLWLIFSWGSQAYEHLVSLVGMTAPPGVLQKLTYIAYQHAPDEIKQIDTVRAYSFGCEQWLVEVDIVLCSNMPLRQLLYSGGPATAYFMPLGLKEYVPTASWAVKAHDIGEALQVKLERLPEVARAFVHLDYESAHRADVEHKEL